MQLELLDLLDLSPLPKVPLVDIVPPLFEFARTLCDRTKKHLDQKERLQQLDVNRRQLRRRLDDQQATNGGRFGGFSYPIGHDCGFDVMREKCVQTGKSAQARKLSHEMEVGDDIPCKASTGNLYSPTTFFDYLWEFKYDEGRLNFDSEIFYFSVGRWRVNLTRTGRGNFGLSLVLLNLVKNGACVGLCGRPNTHKHFDIVCEFKLHCNLRPTYCRSKTLSFSSRMPSERGFKNFIGSDLLSYVDNSSRLTISLRLQVPVGADGHMCCCSGRHDTSGVGMEARVEHRASGGILALHRFQRTTGSQRSGKSGEFVSGIWTRLRHSDTPLSSAQKVIHSAGPMPTPPSTVVPASSATTATTSHTELTITSNTVVLAITSNTELAPADSARTGSVGSVVVDTVSETKTTVAEAATGAQAQAGVFERGDTDGTVGTGYDGNHILH